MSGHSKWNNIKRRKGAQDAKRGAIFGKLSKAITVAAKEGGGDPEDNPALSLAIQKAKSNNMPNDNIQRAIDKGTGAGADAAAYEWATYEGYAPGGVAVMVEALTDNKNRTASEVRGLFSKHNGKLGKDGSVGYLFDRKGVILVPTENAEEEELMELALEAGAEDVEPREDEYRVLTDPQNFTDVRAALDDAEISYESADVTMIPQNTVRLDSSDARQTLKLIDILDDHDDIQEVYSNFDVSEEVMAEVAG